MLGLPRPVLAAALALVGLPVVANEAPRAARPRLTLGRDTTRVMGPLDADGLPNYAAVLNERMRVPPDHNAAVLLVSVFGPDADDAMYRAMGVAPDAAAKPLSIVGGVHNIEPLAAHVRQRAAAGGVPGLAEVPADFESAFMGEWLAASTRAWRESDLPLVAEWLRANEAPLARIGEAVRRPRLWVPLPEDRSLIEAPVMNMLKVRNAANLLRARALLRVGRGDWGGAAEDVRTIDRLAVLLDQEPFLIEALIAMALRGIAGETVAALTGAPGTPAKELDGLRSDLGAAPDLHSPRETIDTGERFLQLSLLVSLVKTKTERTNWRELAEADEEAEKLLGPVPNSAIDWDEVARGINRLFDAMVAEMGVLPASARRGAHDRQVQATKNASDAYRTLTPARRDELVGRAANDPAARAELGRVVGGLIFAVATPSLLRSEISWIEADAVRQVGLLALTASAKTTGGRPPSALGDIVPEGWNPIAVRHGYRFAVQSAGSDVAVTAVPDDFEFTGRVSLCADRTGRTALTLQREPQVDAGRCIERPQP